MRRSGSLARQVLVEGRGIVGRVGRRRDKDGVTTQRTDADAFDPLAGRRLRSRQVAAAPVSPALPPVRGVDAEAGMVSIPLLPGERTPARRVKFAIANGCTVASLVLGMVAVFLAINGELRFAAVALLGCVAFDGCDGGLARRFGVASPFGAQMDSLADLSSFGVATGIVVYQWLIASGASPAAAAPVCALIAVCAAIRLARFNVSPKDGRFFTGVPTTMIAAVLALATQLSPDMPASARVAVVALAALAMVSSFPYAKLTRVVRLPIWVWLLPLVGVLINPAVTFVLVVLAYLVSGPLIWLHQRQTRRVVAP
ncbi:CDP-alcohol phosphatidyltransferase family protein [Luedemannella helvata]|uniref:CDP-alcohol phosphatidyltransferase family protein n=1 Tax=Luedemannella helvata TaxID=349315 RepID=UPI003CD0BA41